MSNSIFNIRWGGICICFVLFICGIIFLAINTISVLKIENDQVWQQAKSVKQTKRLSSAPVIGYEVINTYPHSAKAFTQGLVYQDDDILYESTGLYGQSSLREVNLTSGQVINSINLDKAYFAEGITVWNNSIFQLTWQQKIVFLYNLQTFVEQRNYTNPSNEGWGLTHDSTSLILSDGSSTIWFLDPATFTSQRKITVTNGGKSITRINELEYIEGMIWANVWLTNNIIVIDPANGIVTTVINFAGLLIPPSGDVLNGIAYDPLRKRIFVTGKLWPKLFEVQVNTSGITNATSTSSQITISGFVSFGIFILHLLATWIC